MRTLDEHTFPQHRLKNSSDPHWLVMKFGGSSVSSADCWATIRDLAAERLAYGLRLVIVHSALAQISDHLEAIIDTVANGDFQQQLNDIRARHLELAASLGVDKKGPGH